MPKFEVGHIKTPGSGRKPSALGKRARFAQQVMIDEKVEPLAALLRIWKNTRLPLEVRLDCLKAAIPYCYPRLSAVSSTSQSEVKMVSVDLIRDNPKLAQMAETLAIELAAGPKLLGSPATEYPEV
jgi:hypothetical protein